jgi:hypothetical protein
MALTFEDLPSAQEWQMRRKQQPDEHRVRQQQFEAQKHRQNRSGRNSA